MDASSRTSAFDELGYLTGIDLLSPDEVARHRSLLDALPRLRGSLPLPLRHKLHLLYPWADALIRHPRILEVIRPLLGEDILCWTLNVFEKPPGSPGFVAWHQDATYWGLEPHDFLTVWVALTDSDPDSGGVQVVPGSHREGLAAHRERWAVGNMLLRGQELDRTPDASQTQPLVLTAGQMSVHHGRLVHGSPANACARARVGLAIRYLPTHVRPVHGSDGAVLVSGEDRHGHFVEEPCPQVAAGLRERAAHARSLQRQARNTHVGEAGLGKACRRSLRQLALGAYAACLEASSRWAPGA